MALVPQPASCRTASNLRPAKAKRAGQSKGSVRLWGGNPAQEAQRMTLANKRPFRRWIAFVIDRSNSAVWPERTYRAITTASETALMT